MKSKLFVLLLVLATSILAAAPIAAAPMSAPCVSGAAYDPACDVNHDGAVNVLDVQITASHWNQTGTWLSDNSHNHLGQVWTGNSPLKIQGAFGAPDYAPLVLNNTAGVGLSIGASDSGVYIDSAGYHGLWVASATNDGLHVNSAGGDGVLIHNAGMPSSQTSSALNNGFEVEGAEGYGMYIGRADSDGIRIRSTADDGIQIGEDGVFPTYGLYVPAPGTANNVLLLHTAKPNGEWAILTPDNISAGNVLLSAQTLLAVVGGGQALAIGEVVTAAGLADALPGSHNRLAQVQRASGAGAGVVGVVSSRLALTPLPGKDGAEELHSIDGPAQAGDYVAITVMGAAQVKVQDGEAIQPGQRLTVGDLAGHVRALRTVQVEGVKVDESGPTLGTALEAADKNGMVWVLVNPQ